ncbi:MAG: regulatory protein RecX [Candidatus Microsaccharimonas sp.]
MRDRDRVNVSVDGKYRFSLDVLQVGSLGLKIGNEYTEAQMTKLEEESQFGKLYTRTLEYALMRPRSLREVTDYLYRKNRDMRTKTGEVRKGVSKQLTERVFQRLVEKGYVDDEKFARFWIENRNLCKGTSRRKLSAELAAKGVEKSIVDQLLGESERTDDDEIKKIIAKKKSRYPDEAKLIAYLARQGFNYDDIKVALADDSED